MGDEKNSHIFLADTKMGILIITVWWKVFSLSCYSLKNS
jgi:hypothetical protein